MRLFDWPWMTAVSIVAAIAMAWLVRASFRRRIERVSRLGTRQLVMRLVPPASLQLPSARATRLGFAALFSAIALAGPRWGEEQTMLRGEGIDIVLALDASLSMLATDERPSRLERLKQEVRRLRAASRGDRFALLAFAGRSYILSPLTVDDGALDLFLDNLDPSIVGQAGSAISRAISQGIDLLQASRTAGDRALVVMSDGEAFEEPLDIVAAAERAGKAGISVVTVGFGTERGSTIPVREGDRIVEKRDENNQVVITKYHPETLRAAATAAQGTFIDASATDKATRIRRALQSLRTTARQVEGGRNGTPRFQLFLIPALLLIFADTIGSLRRRRDVASVRGATVTTAGLVMLVNGCALPGAQAARGADQFGGGQYARAAASYRTAIADGDQRPEMLYNLGTALVAADSLDRALEPLERATLAEREELRYRALFNLGLAQLKVGKAGAHDADSTRRALATAVELYKRVLLMRPGDADAIWNYELAQTELSQQSSGGASQPQNEPEPQPDPREPPSPSLGREQAEQLLSSAARDEQAVQGRKQREARPTAPRRGKDWWRMQSADCRLQIAEVMRIVRSPLLLHAALCILHSALVVSTPVAAQDTVRASSGPGIASRAPLNASDDIAFRAMTLPDTVWVGQQATYQVGVFLSDEIRGRLRRNPVFVPPELRSMLAYDLASLNSVPRYAGSRRYEVHVFQRALFPLTAGRHEIPPARLEYALPLSNSFFAREESHSARTQSLVVIAREPPATGRPPGYKGAVGRLALQTRIDGRSQRTGDPFTFTAVVSGTGNVSLLPRPELAVPWADVVPGAVRVQMDSSTTLVRGRKEFDWILTPVRPGRQAVPGIHYPFFNPYSEQYEVAFGRVDSVAVTGDPVVADGSTADSTPVLPVRRTYEGEVPEPITESTVFWALVALAPLPFLSVLFGRRVRVIPVTPPEAQLRSATREGRADAALVRRIFARAVADRTHVGPTEMANQDGLRRALRRVGVSESTAADASALLAALDESVFGAGGASDPANPERAIVLLRAIDQEARSRAAIAARRVHRSALGLGLGLIISATAWAASQDLVASTVFANGLEAYDAREFGSARQAFFELAQARPRAADAWFNFATASWQLEDTAAAVIGWQRAMRLDPMTSDVRARLRLAPGSPRLWHGVPPISLSLLGGVGAASWIAGFVLLAVGRRRRHQTLTRVGLTLAAGAVIVLLGGIKHRDIVDGHNAAVVMSAARLRAMPVLSSEAGIEAQPGEVATILGHQGAWMRVELTDRRKGWVEAARLQPLAQTEATFSISR